MNGEVTSPAITLAGSARTVSAGSWASELFTAEHLGSFTSRGDFSGKFYLMGQNVAGQSLSLLNVAGQMEDATVRAPGGIAVVSIGSMLSSGIFVCVQDAVTSMPGGAGDFQAPLTLRTPTIGRFMITDVNGLFQDSLLVAPSLGAVVLRGVQSNNAGVPFGLAVIDKISSLLRYHPVGRPSRGVNITASLNNLPAEGEFEVNVV